MTVGATGRTATITLQNGVGGSAGPISYVDVRSREDVTWEAGSATAWADNSSLVVEVL